MEVIDHTSNTRIMDILKGGTKKVDKVIFRKFKEGDVIALLPDNEAHFGMVDSYQHIGQHGEASTSIIERTKPAKPEEYDDLLSELESIGYKPKVYKRLQYGWLNWQ